MTLASDQLRAAVQTVPAGSWVVGVSGGADSVALLLAMRQFRPDATLVVAHLDHQTRGADSDGDREFVATLARSLAIPARIARIEAFETIRHGNLEARFRLARFALFRDVIAEHSADGVLLAHHADDRAETTMLRLLRGGEYTSLDALRPTARVEGIEVHRPLLGIGRETIEAFLRDSGQVWREDQSNTSEVFARNRVRKFLSGRSEVVGRLLQLADAAGAVRQWVDDHVPVLEAELRVDHVADLPDLLARRAVRDWLRSHQVVTQDISPATIDQLLLLVRDAATGRAINLPGGFIVRRKRSQVSVTRGAI